MFYAVFAEMELSQIGQEGSLCSLAERHIVKSQGVAGYGFQANTAYGAHVSAEVCLEQRLTQAHSLEYFGTPIASDGGYTHLSHNLEEAFLHGLDIVGLGRFIVFLYLAALHQIVEDGVGEIWAEGRRTIAQQQGGVHHLPNLSALHDKRCLHTLAHGDEIVVHGAHGQQ